MYPRHQSSPLLYSCISVSEELLFHWLTPRRGSCTPETEPGRGGQATGVNAAHFSFAIQWDMIHVPDCPRSGTILLHS